MKNSRVETWSRAAETAVLALVFLAPLAAHGRTWDPEALRAALVQACALTLAAAWLLKGLARGRFEAGSGLWPALAPAAAFAAWSLARFLASPYKGAAMPELAATLAALALYAVAALELGGARHAARLAFWTTCGAAIVAAVSAVLHFTKAPWTPDQMAGFVGAALPATLALRLDPETTPTRRVLSLLAGCALSFAAGWSGSGDGLVLFIFAAVLFSIISFAFLRGPQTRQMAAASLGFAALALIAAKTGSPGSRISYYAGEPWSISIFKKTAMSSGVFSATLLAWLMLAAAISGLRSTWDLRRRGAIAEAGYAAAFSAIFCAWAALACWSVAFASGPAAWLAWAAIGVAAGMAPLSRARGIVRTVPLPFGEDVRRLMQGPVLMIFAGLAAWPGLWLASDVSYNRAVAEARAGNLDAALADAGRTWPGAAVAPAALYLRGNVLAAQGKPAEALEAYARLDRVAPDFARSHSRKADAYALTGDWASSAREREAQAALTPLDVANLAAWAEAARAAGDLASARRAATRAEALAPDAEIVRTQVAANALMERKLAERDGESRRNGRKGLALKPKRR